MLRPLFLRLARSRPLAQVLFGLELPPLAADEHYFDVTTLALLRAARRRVPRGARVLDLGCGSAALLGLWLWKRLDCQVTCTEVAPSIAARARESVALNSAPLEVLEGESFAGLESRFDFVLFNPPYVPTRVGLARGLPQRTRTQWDGGEDGTQALAGFLAALEREGRGATALLGVNHNYVPRKRVLAQLERHAALALTEVVRRPWLRSEVYVLVSRKSPSASASSPEA